MSAFELFSGPAISKIRAPVIAVLVFIPLVIPMSGSEILFLTSLMVSAYCPLGHLTTTAAVRGTLLILVVGEVFVGPSSIFFPFN